MSQTKQKKKLETLVCFYLGDSRSAEEQTTDKNKKKSHSNYYFSYFKIVPCDLLIVIVKFFSNIEKALVIF